MAECRHAIGGGRSGSARGPRRATRHQEALRASVLVVAFAVALAMALAVLLAFIMVMLLCRHVLLLVPVLLHEVDRLAAGVVLAAVLLPVLCMAGGHVQIDRLLLHDDRRRRDDHGL